MIVFLLAVLLNNLPVYNSFSVDVTLRKTKQPIQSTVITLFDPNGYRNSQENRSPFVVLQVLCNFPYTYVTSITTEMQQKILQFARQSQPEKSHYEQTRTPDNSQGPIRIFYLE